MNAQLQQAYEVWKRSAQEYMAEMDEVIAGQEAGGRLLSTKASMEFNYQLLETIQQELEEAPE